jgi:c(7)-type cytochrome triheme protein
MEMLSTGKDCTVCHNGIYHIVTKKNPAFTMAEMEAGQACGFCHDGKQAFSVAGDCTSCHAGDIRYINDDAGNIVFSHDLHLGMFGCEECHPDLFKPERGNNPATMEEMENGQSCGACHDGNPATMEEMENGQSCGACHDGSTAFSVAGDCAACHEM